MNCNECSATLNDNAKFCKECGAKVENSTVISSDDNLVESIAPQSGAEKINHDPQNTATQANTNTISLDFELVKNLLIGYGQFLKETFMNPSSLFGTDSWIYGIVSLLIFTGIQSYLVNYDYFTNFFQFLIIQSIVVGVLLIINKFLLNTSDNFYNVVTEYGGLINTQSLLFILAAVVGLDEGIGAFIMFIAFLNQINIFNYYLFKNQTKGSTKIDGYYQIIIAYIALAILMYFSFRGFLNF